MIQSYSPGCADAHPKYMLPCTHANPHPKRHLDRFSCFCRLTTVSDRQTDHAAPSVIIGRVDIVGLLRCGLIIRRSNSAKCPLLFIVKLKSFVATVWMRYLYTVCCMASITTIRKQISKPTLMSVTDGILTRTDSPDSIATNGVRSLQLASCYHQIYLLNGVPRNLGSQGSRKRQKYCKICL